MKSGEQSPYLCTPHSAPMGVHLFSNHACVYLLAAIETSMEQQEDMDENPLLHISITSACLPVSIYILISLTSSICTNTWAIGRACKEQPPPQSQQHVLFASCPRHWWECVLEP